MGELDDTTGASGDRGLSRREALQKGAKVGGAVLWVTPLVQSLSLSPAAAQQPSPPVNGDCPGCPTCAAQARGLHALGINVAEASGTHCVCVVDANVNLGQLAGAAAEVVCASADSGDCRASSYVAGARIRIGANAFLEASVLSSCVSCGTGDSVIVDLDLVTSTLGVETRTDLLVVGGCNEGIDLSPHGFPLVQVVANEQFCQNGVLTVRALRVTVLGLDVIVAESKAGGAGCPCEPCSANPSCTPPTSQLCA